jgi:hypothetical protein
MVPISKAPRITRQEKQRISRTAGRLPGRRKVSARPNKQHQTELSKRGPSRPGDEAALEDSGHGMGVFSTRKNGKKRGGQKIVGSAAVTPTKDDLILESIGESPAEDVDARPVGILWLPPIGDEHPALRSVGTVIFPGGASAPR